jgi:hypothetical protein
MWMRYSDAMRWSHGRVAVIKQGLITGDLARIEFERIAPIDEPSFATIAQPPLESNV